MCRACVRARSRRGGWRAMARTPVCPRVRVRVLVRVRVGISPCGVRTLAVWPLDSRRVALPHLCTLGWGAGETRVEWSAIHPVPDPKPVPDPQRCPMCPHPRRGCDRLSGGLHGVLSPLLVSGYEPRRLASRSDEAVTGFGELGLGGQRVQQRSPSPSLTKFPYLNEDRQRRR